MARRKFSRTGGRILRTFLASVLVTPDLRLFVFFFFFPTGGGGVGEGKGVLEGCLRRVPNFNDHSSRGFTAI